MSVRRWSVRTFGETIVLTDRSDAHAMTSATRISALEASFAIRSLSMSAPALDMLVRVELSSALEHIGAAAGRTSRSSLHDVCAAVADAVRQQRLIAFRTSRPTAIERPVKVEVLGPQSDSWEEPLDVYVIAAEVKLIGDTPLIEHPVRIIDPDTQEIIVEATTDAKGIVRAEVPKKKTYRIEIVELDPQWTPEPQANDPPKGVVHFRLVDEAGQPLVGHDVTVKVDDEELVYVTDEAGEVSASAHIGHYEVIVGDDTFYGHTVLPRDAEGDVAYRFIVPVKQEGTGDADDPIGRLERYDDLYADDSFEEGESFA